MFLFGCGGNKLDAYDKTTPVLYFDQFFNGHLVGNAIVQDRSGQVIKSFTLDMIGSWSGTTGTLREHFIYNDGTEQDRVWNVTKIDDTHYKGTAGDIIGTALGESRGSAIKWNYSMSVPVGNSSYTFDFDDWMFLMNDHLIINRSAMKKFGITVGDITIMIEKK